MSLRAAGYGRVSTEEQAQSGHSLEAQQQAIEQWAGQKGWQLLEVHLDAGVSGTLSQRPALNRLLRQVDAGQVDVVIVHSIDRLYRHLESLLKTINRWQQQQVSLVSITEQLDFTTPWGKLTVAVLGTLAEIYIDKLSAETKKGKLQRARKGLYNGSIPLGYCAGRCQSCRDPNGPGYCPHVGQPDRAEDEALIAHPLESLAVQHAFKLAAAGHTDREIAVALNALRVEYQGQEYRLRPKRRPGDIARFGPPEFGKDTVRELLQRVFYTGVVPYFGVRENGQKRKRRDAVALYPGRHPALVEQAVYEQVQSVRSLRVKAPLAMGASRHVYPLTGLLRCGYCGGRLRGSSNAQGQRYYRCATRLQQGDCQQPTVYADEVEEQLFTLLRGLALAPDWRRRVSRAVQQLTPAEAEEVAGRLARAKELYLAGDLSRAAYQREKSLYGDALNLTELAFDSMLATGYLLRNIGRLWSPGDGHLKRKLLRSLVAAVTIRESALTDWTPNSAFYTLLRHGSLSGREGLCRSGSDGCPPSSKNKIRWLPPDIAN
ncbi:MAG: recombinase family protein [Anaerolineae bacterium]